MKHFYNKTSLQELQKGFKFKNYIITEIINYSTNLSLVQCYDEFIECYCRFIFLKKEGWYCYRKIVAPETFRKEVEALSNEELMDIE